MLAAADDEQGGLGDLREDGRPRPQQRVLALAGDEAGHADHDGAVAEAVAVPDGAAGRRVGAEDAGVDAGVQPGHPGGGGGLSAPATRTRKYSPR